MRIQESLAPCPICRPQTISGWGKKLLVWELRNLWPTESCRQNPAWRSHYHSAYVFSWSSPMLLFEGLCLLSLSGSLPWLQNALFWMVVSTVSLICLSCVIPAGLETAEEMQVLLCRVSWEMFCVQIQLATRLFSFFCSLQN